MIVNASLSTVRDFVTIKMKCRVTSSFITYTTHLTFKAAAIFLNAIEFLSMKWECYLPVIKVCTPASFKEPEVVQTDYFIVIPPKKVHIKL